LTPALLRRLSVPILLVAGALTAWLGFHAANIGIEHDNASLRTTDLEELRTYTDFREAFGNDEDILVAVGHPRLLDADGLALVADLTKDIAAMDGVARVWSLATAEELVAGDVGAEPQPLLAPPWDAPDIRSRSEAALARNPDFNGWLVSGDRRVAGLVVEIEDRPDDTEYRKHLVAALRELSPRVAQAGGELHLTGVPVQKIDVSDYVDRDQKILLPVAVLVLSLTLALFFRHYSGVLVPVAVAGITVAWTVGLYATTGHSTNAITALLPPVLLVIALATTIHVYDAWLEDRDGGGDDGYARATRAVRAVFVPGLLCAVTTAQGFLSLTLGDLPAVRQFGIFAAFGAFAAFAIAMTVAPAALARIPPPPNRTARGHGWTRRLLDTSASLATERPGAVLVVFAVVTVVAIAGIPMVRSNTDLVGFLRKDAPLRLDTEWIDANLGGTLPLEFLVRRKDGSPVADLATVEALDEIERRTRTREHVAGATSVLALVRQVHRAETKSGKLELPVDAETLQEELDLLDESGHALVGRFLASEATALRLTVRLRSVGSAVSAPLVREIRRDAAALLPPDVEFLPTGTLWEVVRDSDELVENQVISFASAIVLVVAAIGLLLRSVAFTLVGMIPNVMPILWTGGLMGYAGIDLSTGTAMIASAVLGLVVDDTIHYLSYYRRVYAGDAVAAIRKTSLAVGAPVTVASTSLVLGFWVGALGSFLPTIYFSLLTGLTMITGVLCDLLVLPASLVLLDRVGRRGR
jgi:predicted RND superfamily exporter protein